jgi:hypothetical protein
MSKTGRPRKYSVEEARERKLRRAHEYYLERKAIDPVGHNKREAEKAAIRRRRYRELNPVPPEIKTAEDLREYQKIKRTGRPKTKTDGELRERRVARQRQYEAELRAGDPVAFAARRIAHAKKYRERHPERAKESNKKCRKNTPVLVLRARARRYRANNIVKLLYAEAKHRSKRMGRTFTIVLGDIPPMGDYCPLLGHPWPAPEVRDGIYSPSIDRIDSSRGYEPGNVWIVGRRANSIKNSGTAEEHEMIAAALRKIRGY